MVYQTETQPPIPVPGMGTLVNTCWGNLVDMSDADAQKYWTTGHDCGPEPGSGPLPHATPGGIPTNPNPNYVNTSMPGLVGEFPVLSLQDAINQHLSYQTAPGIANEVGLGTETVANLIQDIPTFVQDYCSIRPGVPGCGNPSGMITAAQNQLRDYYTAWLAAASTQPYNYPALNNGGGAGSGGGAGGGSGSLINPTTFTPDPNDPMPSPSSPLYPQWVQRQVNKALAAKVPVTQGGGAGYVPNPSIPHAPLVNFTDPQNLGSGNIPITDPSTWTTKTWIEVGAGVVGLITLMSFMGKR